MLLFDLHGDIKQAGGLHWCHDEKRGCRLAEGGCTAVLDCTGSFSDAAKVGDPQYQAPEVLCAFSNAKIQYTPSGEHIQPRLGNDILHCVHPFLHACPHACCACKTSS